MVDIRPVHDGGDKPLAAVIFIHGLDGGPYVTWMSDRDDHETLWPLWLKEVLPRFAICTIGYEASKTSWRGGHALAIDDRAASLYDLLMPCLRPTGVLYALPLVLVTHSMGGLIAKSMLRKSFDDPKRGNRDLLAQTKGMVFIATPHAGSGAAGWANLTRILSRPSAAVRDMAPHDAGLRNLNQWYKNNAEGQGIISLAFYETKSTSGLTIVDATSADPALSGLAPKSIDADHIKIAKPATRDAPLYVQIVDFLKDIQSDVLKEKDDSDSSDNKNFEENVHDQFSNHGYRSSLDDAFPSCAELIVEPKQGTNETTISAIARLRCSRERLRGDDHRSFWLAARSIRIALLADGGEICPRSGFGDHVATGKYKILRSPHDVITISSTDGDNYLEGLVLDEALLPMVNVRRGERCSLRVQLGAFSEDLDIDIIGNDEESQQVDASELKRKLIKVVVSKALDRMDDQIILSQAKLEPRRPI